MDYLMKILFNVKKHTKIEEYLLLIIKNADFTIEKSESSGMQIEKTSVILPLRTPVNVVIAFKILQSL